MPPAGGPPPAVPRAALVAFVLLFCIVLAAGIYFYLSQEQQITEQQTRDLSAIAHLKVDQVTAWREDRLYDARVLSASPSFIQTVDQYFSSGDAESRRRITERFTEMRSEPDYQNILLVDPQGTVRFSTDPAITVLHPAVKELVSTSLANGTATLTDFHTIPGTDRVHLDIIAPLAVKTEGTRRPVGAVILSVDPERNLYPIIRSWPVTSESAESLLVERQGDHVLFLNNLRFRNNTALNLTIPLTRTDVPAVMAVLGTTGAFEGADYRGVDVISVLNPVPGTPWYMVTKIDTEEVYAGWRSRAGLIIALIVITAAGVVVVAGLIWQRRQKYYYRSLYAAESAHRAEEERNRLRMETLLRLSGMDAAPEQELFDFVLDAVYPLMESPLAFIGTVSADESGIDITAWSKSTMKYCEVTTSPLHFPIGQAGIWADAVRKRQPVLVNDYALPLPEKKGLPEGHVPIRRFIAVPILDGDRIVMVSAVANKETDYRQEDVDQLLLLMQGVWAQIRKHRADEALRQKTSDLEAAYEEITASEEELRANYEELAKTQGALRESERKYRNLYTYAEVGLFETSFKDATVVTCNEHYAALAGFSSVEEAIGSDILHLYVHPEDRTDVGRILREQGHIENRILELRNHATGKIFWAQFSARFNYEREIAEGSLIDITARKTAEAALRESEEAFRSLAENANDGFLIGDARGMHVFANRRAAEITGYSIDELIRTSIRQIARPDEYERVLKDRFRKRLAGEPAPNQYETILVGKDGRDIPIELTSAKIQWYGQPADLVVFRDIAKRKAMIENLRESERRLREAQEMAHLGFWSWDVGTGAVEWSDEVYRIFGLDPESFTPEIDSVLALSPWPEDQQRDKELIERAMASREPGTYEQRFLRPDKSTGYYHSTFQGRYNEAGDLVSIVGTVLDITDRILSEKALRESESRFRGVFDRSTAGKSITSAPEGDLLRINQAFADMLGYTVEELQQMNWADITHPEDQPESRECMRSLLAGERTDYRMEKRYVRKSGRIVWGDVGTTLMRDAAGQPLYLITTIVEITERKKAERALQESEQRYRSLFENMQEGLAYCRMIYDRDDTPVDFVYIAVNHAFDQIIGTGTVTGRPVTEVFPGIRDAFPQLFEIYGRVARTAVPESFDIEFTPVGKWLHISVYSPARDYFVAVFSDITERKAAEEAIREANEILSQAQTLAHVGSWHYLPATGRVIWSDETYRIFGYEPGGLDLTLENIRRAIHPEDLERHDRVLAAAAATGYYEPEEYRLIRPDGTIRTIAGDGNVFRDGSGITVKIMGVIQDITERKEAERQREILIRDLEQKNAELERFTYTVSHDLKSPLITIRGFAGLLEDDAKTGNPDQLKRDVGRISRAADTMQALLNDVLELSRIGRIVNPPSRVPFGMIAREAVELLEGPLTERGITVEIAPDLPVVLVDHTRIREVMVNLIENAVKFSGDRPDPKIHIGMETGGAMPVFFVRDNGIGIDPRYLNRIFNLFEKLDPSAAGTGIGLPIVRRIVEVHGGKIWAESEGPGKGTTFRFTLPAPTDKNNIS